VALFASTFREFPKRGRVCLWLRFYDTDYNEESFFVRHAYFLGALQVTYNDITVGLDVDPEKGSADSGDLEIDLPNLFVAIAEAAEDRKCAVAVLIDEVQYFNQKELGALIMAMHKLQQRRLPLVLFGAGLPILAGLAGESKSYAERLFSFQASAISPSPPLG